MTNEMYGLYYPTVTALKDHRKHCHPRVRRKQIEMDDEDAELFHWIVSGSHKIVDANIFGEFLVVFENGEREWMTLPNDHELVEEWEQRIQVEDDNIMVVDNLRAFYMSPWIPADPGDDVFQLFVVTINLLSNK